MLLILGEILIEINDVIPVSTVTDSRDAHSARVTSCCSLARYSEHDAYLLMMKICFPTQT